MNLTKEQKEFYESHGIDVETRYMGQKANRGKITLQPFHPIEGYAVLKCGNTEVKIGYTLLHHLRVANHSYHPYFKELNELQNAIFSITCEASGGGKGD